MTIITVFFSNNKIIKQGSQGCFFNHYLLWSLYKSKIFWILLLKENYPDIARCCYYEYHYLWQVVRVLNFWCQPIRVQDYGNWPIRGKRSYCVVINVSNEVHHSCNLSKIQSSKVKMNLCCCFLRHDMNNFT